MKCSICGQTLRKGADFRKTMAIAQRHHKRFHSTGAKRVTEKLPKIKGNPITPEQKTVLAKLLWRLLEFGVKAIKTRRRASKKK